MNAAVTGPKRGQFDLNLEGLRGLLALVVGVGHIFGIEHNLDPAYDPHFIGLNIGHSAVLMFFLLSGYVIGLTNQKPFSRINAIHYLWRRGLRLLPIYVIAIALGWLAYTQTPLGAVLANLFFLQNIVTPAIKGNSPVWSLSFEVAYYLIFLLIWRFRPRLMGVVLFCAAISVLGWFNPQMPQPVQSYASGFIFWLAGLGLARIQPDAHSTKVPLLSYLLLFYALAQFNLGMVLMQGLGLPSPAMGQVHLADLISVLAICLVLMAVVTRRSFPGLKGLTWVCFLMPLPLIAGLLVRGDLMTVRWLPATLAYGLALALGGLKLKLDHLAIFEGFGRISYGFYLVHYPLLLLVQQYFPLSGSPATFCLRLGIWIALCGVVSRLLELSLQPWVKQGCAQWLCRYQTAPEGS